MKHITIGIFFIIFCINVRADYWTQLTDFGGIARAADVGFCIDGKCYIGTGWNFASVDKDFWEYDPVTTSWTQKADFGGGGRIGAVGFAIGSKGYIGTGIFNGNVKKDFWEYNPDLNDWNQKADFGGNARDYAVGFELSGKGYIGTGYNSISTNYSDFWQYDPLTNTWIQKANYAGGARSSAIGFSIDGKGYIGTGYAAGPKSDFYDYDPLSNSWTQISNSGGGSRSDGTGFSINGKGYICSGDISGVAKKDLWEYDPINDTWVQKSSLPASGRTNAVSFSDGTVGYIATGFDQSFNGLKDFWEYTPDGISLPIELQSFAATQKAELVSLDWTTTSEIDNSYFTVERSADGKQFQSLDVIKGAGTSTTTIKYQYLDMHPLKGINYYRLKQTDVNNLNSYSNVIAIDIIPESNAIDYLINVYPNPVTNDLMVNTGFSEEKDLHIRICDLDGKLMIDRFVKMENGQQQLDLDLSHLQNGIYLFGITSNSINYSMKLLKNN